MLFLPLISSSDVPDGVESYQERIISSENHFPKKSWIRNLANTQTPFPLPTVSEIAGNSILYPSMTRNLPSQSYLLTGNKTENFKDSQSSVISPSPINTVNSSPSEKSKTNLNDDNINPRKRLMDMFPSLPPAGTYGYYRFSIMDMFHFPLPEAAPVTPLVVSTPIVPPNAKIKSSKGPKNNKGGKGKKMKIRFLRGSNDNKSLIGTRKSK